MDRQNLLGIKAFYGEEHYQQFDVAAAQLGSLCRASNTKHPPEWMFASAAGGPRQRFIQSTSSIEGGDRLVQYN